MSLWRPRSFSSLAFIMLFMSLSFFTNTGNKNKQNLHETHCLSRFQLNVLKNSIFVYANRKRTFGLGTKVVLLSAQVGLLPFDLGFLLLAAPQISIDGIDPRRYIWLVANFTELFLQVFDGSSGVADSLLVVLLLHLLKSECLFNVVNL